MSSRKDKIVKRLKAAGKWLATTPCPVCGEMGIPGNHLRLRLVDRNGVPGVENYYNCERAKP